MGLLDKLLFWRSDDTPEFGVDGCFTLPGAEIGIEADTPDDRPADGDACEATAADDTSGSSW